MIFMPCWSIHCSRVIVACHWCGPTRWRNGGHVAGQAWHANMPGDHVCNVVTEVGASAAVSGAVLDRMDARTSVLVQQKLLPSVAFLSLLVDLKSLHLALDF